MFVVFYGASGVGKSSVMRHLQHDYNWHIISNVLTRPLRTGETEKISISRAEFLCMQNNEEFAIVNEFYGNLYGILHAEIVEAVANKEQYYAVDFSYSRKHMIAGIPHLEVILLPQDLDQLSQQLADSGRTERLASALEDYNKNFSVFENESIAVVNRLIAINERRGLNNLAKVIDTWVRTANLS